MMKLHLFVGPTAFGLEQAIKAQPDVLVHPPVKRGDIDRLVSSTTSGNIAIVDGTFHSFPSVGHIEIRKAMKVGWRVWGLSSMGAIRASEMRHMGVNGYGTVYEHYSSDPEFDDDEVTLLHEDGAPFRALSEPLIHIRGFVGDLVAKKNISETSAHEIIKTLKERWYAERTLHKLKKLLIDIGNMSTDEVQSALYTFDDYRVKSIDLVDFLASRCWQIHPRY